LHIIGEKNMVSTSAIFKLSWRQRLALDTTYLQYSLKHGAKTKTPLWDGKVVVIADPPCYRVTSHSISITSPLQAVDTILDMNTSVAAAKGVGKVRNTEGGCANQ